MTRASDALTCRHLPAWLLLGMQGSVDGGQARRLWRSRWRGLHGRGGIPPPTDRSQGHRSPPERARFDRPSPEEHTSELQSRPHPVCRLLLEKKKFFASSFMGSAPSNTRSTPLASFAP